MSTILERIREKHHLSDAAPVGVVGTFGKDMSTDRENRQVWVIANTDDVDLQNEVVVPSGADTAYFRKNGNVFADHQTNMDCWVGKLRDMSPSPSAREFKSWKVGIWCRKTELGDDILTMANEGGVGVSIGFIPEDWGKPTDIETKTYGGSCESIVRRWKWLELSFTPFPCNVSCQTQMVTRSAGKPEIIETLLSTNRIKRASAVSVGFPVRPSPGVRVKWSKHA